MKLRLICLEYVVVLLCLTNINADDEVLGKLESIYGRIGNIEETLDEFADAVSKMDSVYETLNGLVDVVSKLENVYECGWPKLAHGHYEGNSSYYRGVLRAFCDEGYTLQGKSLIKCQADGIWTEFPKCAGQCQPPNVPNSVELDKTYYILDSQVDIKCNPGYYLDGSGTTVCLGDNKWSNIVVCRPVECGRPLNQLHGTYGDDYSTTFNSALSLECDEGYVRGGPDVIRCTERGYWTGEQGCLERVCLAVTVHGTSTTKCLLKQEAMAYIGGTNLGEIRSSDVNVCFQNCFENFPTFAYLVINADWDACTCFEETGNDYPNYAHILYSTYFQEDKLSIYAL